MKVKKLWKYLKGTPETGLDQSNHFLEIIPGWYGLMWKVFGNITTGKFKADMGGLPTATVEILQGTKCSPWFPQINKNIKTQRVAHQN